MFTFFEPLPSESTIGLQRAKVTDGLKLPGERRPPSKVPTSRSSSKSSHSSKTQRAQPSNPEKKTGNSNYNGNGGRRQSPDKTSWNVLDLKAENYFSCSVGRTRTNARYLLSTSDDVVAFMKELADESSSSLGN